MKEGRWKLDALPPPRHAAAQCHCHFANNASKFAVAHFPEAFSDVWK